MEKELRIINTKRASAFKKDLQKMVMLHQYLRKMILKNQKKKKKKNWAISLSPVISKIFERIMHNQMGSYFYNFLTPCLCGYPKD